MGHNPMHDGLDALFRRIGGDKNAFTKYKRNQEKERKGRSRSHDDSYDRGEVLYGRQGLVRRNRAPDSGPQQPVMNYFQSSPRTPFSPLQRPPLGPLGIPQLQGPPPMQGIPQAGVHPKLLARYRGGQRQVFRHPLAMPGAQQFPPPGPLYPIPQAQPGVPSYHPSATAAPAPESPSRVPSQASSQHQSSSAQPQSSQRGSSQHQSSQREPSSHNTLKPPPSYKTISQSGSQRHSSQREASSHSTLKPPPPSSQSSSQRHSSERPSARASESRHSTKPSERLSGTPTNAVKTKNYKLGGMARTVVEGQVARSSPSNSKTATTVSKTHDYRLGKMERTIVEGQVPGSKTRGGSNR